VAWLQECPYSKNSSYFDRKKTFKKFLRLCLQINNIHLNNPNLNKPQRKMNKNQKEAILYIDVILRSYNLLNF
jgi:hypothetical protein